jgi:hypothetical protein
VIDPAASRLDDASARSARRGLAAISLSAILFEIALTRISLPWPAGGG